MAMKHYEGELGVFDYDDEQFNLRRVKNDDFERQVFRTFEGKPCLVYIGNETDGSKIHIPEGLISVDFMFAGNHDLETPPLIPDGTKSMNYTFKDCINLIKASNIPNGTTSCEYTYAYCDSMVEGTDVPGSVKDVKGMHYANVSLKEPSLFHHGTENFTETYYCCNALKFIHDLPKTAKFVTQMCWHCSSLEKAIMVPKRIKHNIQHGMFDHCKDSVMEAGDWNFAHRGKDYYVDGPGNQSGQKNFWTKLISKLPGQGNEPTKEDNNETALEDEDKDTDDYEL